MRHLKPIVGQWYLHHDKGQMFEVVSIDNADGAVEMQDYDGNLDEVDIKTWFGLDIEAIEAPEDWTGPLDAVELDDARAADAEMPNENDWTQPLRPLRAEDVEAWQDTAPDEHDDWGEGAPAEPFVADEPEAARLL